MSVEEEEVMPDDNLEEEEQEEYDEEGDGENMGQDPDAAGEEEVSGAVGKYNAKEVNEQIFEELVLGPGVAEEVQNIWTTFLRAAESREAAGEAIYAALFDSAPSLQSLFKTPRAVMAMRFMNGLNQIISSLNDPKALKVIVETLGFQHLDLEVTPPRVVIFRDAIVDLLSVEMGSRLTPKGRDGWCTFLNYVGGSYIYIRVKFAERLKILNASWATATKKDQELTEEQEAAEADGLLAAKDGEGEDHGGTTSQDVVAEEDLAKKKLEMAKAAEQTKKKRNNLSNLFGGAKAGSEEHAAGASDGKGESSGTDMRNTSIPTTFDEMFTFNAAVMGFGNATWMNEILYSFDAIVTNVANSYRLQEECDVLSLRMSKYKGTMVLSQFKAVMLASLRSLCKDWGSLHEVSWSWLWENVERMIKALIGKPQAQQRALTTFFTSLGEKELGIIRREVYTKFFAIAPAGQDYFKQSTTRLFFIADKLVQMTLDMYKEPKRMVEDISALGLRHVGYGIPTDLFGPFVTACVQVIRMLSDDDAAEEAFRWSLSLISRILTRVINEGSTIVMKAINANSGKQLKKAVGCAPRGKRSLWMLNVQVGTQSISPLLWAIETGSLEAAKAIIIDLLTIRADRDRYYYGMDIMFERHADLVKRLCLDAPALLPTLLDGLIWRSRVTENGQRRTNYYIKYFIVDSEGGFSKVTEVITDNGDPTTVCHPVVSMVTDMIWSRVALRTFLWGKAWFLFTLVVFVCSQSILNHLNSHADDSKTNDSEAGHDRRLASDGNQNSFEIRLGIFVCRCFIYLCSMGQWLTFHFKYTIRDIRAGDYFKFGPLKLPAHLGVWQGAASMGLTICLIGMLCLEPILHCVTHADEDSLFTEHCQEGEQVLFAYSIMSTLAMLLYFLLLSDLSVFSTRVSAFVLVCTRVISELLLFLFALCFIVLAFACAVSALEQEDPDFAGIPLSSLQLFKITFGMFSGAHYDILTEYPALFFTVVLYVITTIIFMLNLLIAQLSCAYMATYRDMLGFARLNRGRIVTETMPAVPRSRWGAFVQSLKLDDRVEFGEGDLGLAGGIQVFEPASANITTVDMIRRFGGSTSPLAQWPADENAGDDEEDRFEKIEKLIEKAMKRMTSTKGGKRGAGESSTGVSGGLESSSKGGDKSASDGGQGSGASE